MASCQNNLDEEGRRRLVQLFDPSVTISAAYREYMVCRELHDRLVADDEAQAASVFG